MAKLFAQIRVVACALALAFVVAVSAPAPVSAQSVNPTASSVKEQQLLDQLKMVQGRGTIPDVNSYMIEHPPGRDWRTYKTVTLKWIGGIAILGILALLVIFYLWRGTVAIEGGRSGRTLVRFNAFERFVHWLTASTFIILGITGLNITFGRNLILPWMGPEGFSTFSQWSKYTHNFLSFAFTIGVVLMFLMWIGQNLPTAADVEWLKAGGGSLAKRGRHAPAWRFNAGQKILYWLIVLGSAAMIVSGYLLIFPFSWGMGVGDMELAAVFHGIVGVLFVALIVAHIYLGTLGMEGAFESMGTGTVDVNWAKEHHPLWVQQEQSRQQTKGGQPLATPAE